MHDHAVLHCSIDYCVELIIVEDNFYENCSNTEMISLGNVLLRGELQIDANNSYFENFESALYMKSGSMP